MAKLLQFRTPNGSGCRASAARATLDVTARLSPSGQLRAKTKEDIRTMILMFDVALMHGRLAIGNVDDRQARQRLEAHLGAIEEMLDLARTKAANL